MKQGGKKDEGSTDPSGERKRVCFKERSSGGTDSADAPHEESNPEPRPEVQPQALGLHADAGPPHRDGTLWQKSYHVDRQPQATLRTVRSFLGIALKASVEERGLVLHVTTSGVHNNERWLEIDIQEDPAEPAICSTGALLLFRGHSCLSSSDAWRFTCVCSMVVEHLNAADHRSTRRAGASRGSCSELFDSSFASEQEDIHFNPTLSEGAFQSSLPETSTRSPDLSEVAKYANSCSANTSVGMSFRTSPWSSEDSGGIFVKDTPSSLAWISATDSMWRVDISDP